MGSKDANKEANAREAWGCMTRLFIGEENQRRFADVATQLGLTVRLMHAVLDLSPTDPKPMRWLADQWFCDASNVTGIVDGLEARGLVRREAASDDRRVKLIRLTDKGVAARQRAVEQLSNPPKGLLGLTADELRSLRRLLEKAATGYDWPS